MELKCPRCSTIANVPAGARFKCVRCGLETMAPFTAPERPVAAPAQSVSVPKESRA